MKSVNKLIISLFFFVIAGSLCISLPSCEKYDLIFIENNLEFKKQLSAYNIYKGNPADLIPFNDYKLYELTTPLFTDYSQKQRLIKLPGGTSMKYSGNGLPEFPEGTIFVKTFFYYNDQTDLSKGKIIIETRLLIKYTGRWNVATYIWNKEQSEAYLQANGAYQQVKWVDGNGKSRTINYHIPKNGECTSCHQSNNTVIPIGFKLRNLNMDVIRNGIAVNQLKYFQDSAMLNPFMISSVSKLPGWQDMDYSVAERARAYFDMNCGHCHNNAGGYADPTNFYLDYESTQNNSKIIQKKKTILKRMESTNSNIRMPKLGTSIIDVEGLELIKEYINSL